MLVEGIFNAPGCSECLHLGEIHKKQSDTWNTQNPTPLEPNIKAANGISTFCCCRLLCLRSLFLGDEKISWTLLLRLTLDSSWQSAWETKCCGKTGEMYTQEWKLKSLSVSLQLYEFLKVAALRNKSKCKHVRVAYERTPLLSCWWACTSLSAELLIIIKGRLCHTVPSVTLLSAAQL